MGIIQVARRVPAYVLIGSWVIASWKDKTIEGTEPRVGVL